MEKTYKFELPQIKEVASTNVRVENGEMFVDVEFKERLDPKDGDFLVDKDGCVFIYRNSVDDCYGCYAGSYCDGTINAESEVVWVKKDVCRYATSEEKANFLERLEKECHKTWNVEKKCLEDIYVPKFGDIVRVDLLDTDYDCEKCKYMVSIYPNKKFVESSYFFDIATLTRGNDIIYTAGSYIKSITKASESEKQELFDKLAEVGKRWNPETKQLENIRWEPFNNEDYCFINEDFIPIWDKFSNKNTNHIFRVKMNNCFKTKEAAQKVADQIKEIFKNSKAE